MTQGIATDAAQAFGGDPFGQYHAAVNVGKVLSDQFGNNLIITGQSLGGGLASAAGVKNEVATITFNAPGLNHNTIGMSQSELSTRASQYVTAYDVRGEFVWAAINNRTVPLIVPGPLGIPVVSYNTMPDAAGNDIYIDSANPAPFPSRLGAYHMPGGILPSVDNYFLGVK